MTVVIPFVGLVDVPVDVPGLLDIGSEVVVAWGTA